MSHAIFHAVNLGSTEAVTPEQTAYLTHWKAYQGISSKKAVYNVIVSTCKAYLPKLRSQCVTREYLDLILLKRCFSIKEDQVRYCPIKTVNATSELLHLEIVDYLTSNNIHFNLGFDQLHLPDKEWLINILYTFNPACDLFTRRFVMPQTAEVDILVNEPIVGDEVFKTAKHPAYAQYLYNREKKRDIKKNLIRKHWQQVQLKTHYMAERTAKRLITIAPNVEPTPAFNAGFSSLRRNFDNLDIAVNRQEESASGRQTYNEESTQVETTAVTESGRVRRARRAR